MKRVVLMMHHEYSLYMRMALRMHNVPAMVHDVSAKGITMGDVRTDATMRHEVGGQMKLHAGSTNPQGSSSYLALEGSFAELLRSALLSVEQDREKIRRSFATHSLWHALPTLEEH